MASISATILHDLLAIRGPTRAAEVCAALGISAPTLSRLVARESRRVVRLGRTRATQYALLKPIAGLPARIPIYRVDARGEPRLIGELIALEPRGTWVVPGRGAGHAHAGLPPVIADMAPAGYLGRRFADAHPALELPPRLQDWSDEHRLIAVARRGEDLPGDLILGEESLDRFLSAPIAESRPASYPRLAIASAAGGAGSSAAGEQPKFTAWRNGSHYLVKFSPGDGSPSDARWRDLLVCEALCLDVLRESGVAAASARIVDVRERRFLEVQRFDRVGPRGRAGVLSLGYLDDDLFGGRDSWTDSAARLRDARLLSEEDARTIRLLEAVGMLVANGDRHFGNISFFADGLAQRPRLALAPAYDMLPMDLAPRAGVVPPFPKDTPTPRARLLDVWPEARTIAARFWSRVAADKRVHADLRKFAGARAATCSS
jgi:hypothetical protein